MGQPSGAESVILLILIVASGWLFWRRFGPVVRIVSAARREPGFTLRPLTPRIGQFVWEVMLQGKVIQDRPLPGIAHAFVFWGFLAFALVTVEHLAEGFGLAPIPRDSTVGQAYFAFVGLFAIVVAVSIAGLFVRRVFVRPVWLGKVSRESGVIAGLIFLLTITYLAEFALADGSPAGKVNWWIHTLVLLAFLPLIPHTKHLHLILSPVAIFAKRTGFSQIPPLAGDDDLGLVAGKDVTDIDALQAFSCVECGRCTEQCPAFNTGKALNPKELILGVRDYLRMPQTAWEQPMVGAHVLEEAIFQCTTCGGCEQVCPVGIQHLPFIVGLRRGRVNTGAWEDTHGTKLFLNMERNGNSLGFPASERQKFIEKNALPVYDGSQEYCLWLGCMGAYDPQGREIVLALVDVLRHLGITFGVLKREKCNGDPARRLGNDLLFQQLAEGNIEQLQTAKVTKLLSICPHCVRTIGTDWAEAGAVFEIEHHTELLARFADKLPKAAGAKEKVVYHDPCYLGRYRNIYDEPRAVLELASEVVEPGRTREKSFCCGAGGGMMFLGEEKGERVNVNRARELAATGADTIAAACPFCQTMFRDALGQVSERPIKLLDVVQITAAGLPRNGTATHSPQ
jgi:Fe-S oxidoreductase